MRTTALQELYDRESTYWWHVGRLSILERQLRAICKGKQEVSILNVGSGTGGTLPILEKMGKVHNIDTSKEALKFLKARGYEGTLIKGHPLPFKDGTFDVVAALDVLEHIEDDGEALKEWIRVLKPGGSLLLTVPAYQWLWSQHDVINNHYRRYIKHELKSKMKVAGFKVNKASYAFVFSFPLVAGARVKAKLSPKKEEVNEYSSFVPVPTAVNKLFVKLLQTEALFQRIMSFPFGTSLLFVCKKQQEPVQE